jgi:NAD(P)-dependent dehydrogenase (short-subunit alcohol dehydrogenase family)
MTSTLVPGRGTTTVPPTAIPVLASAKETPLRNLPVPLDWGVQVAPPSVIETTTFGHPTFQAGKKRTFVVLDDHEQPEMLCLVFKADRAEQAALVDGVRFFASKFGAKHGWTAMRVDARTDWRRAKALVVASYRRVALKRMVVALDGHGRAT